MYFPFSCVLHADHGPNPADSLFHRGWVCYWHEHFGNVTRLVGWDEHVGIRSNYDQFIAAMKKWFTRIHLTAVQAQLFHNRQQQEKETVDLFTQGLNAEIMGRTLLANQYVTGLRPELKRKLIGVGVESHI